MIILRLEDIRWEFVADDLDDLFQFFRVSIYFITFDDSKHDTQLFL